ncbi:MAG: FtsX-like permease family protein [Capnocytophaga sp.]|nr:FtsX-like permease family protein [Capnocytophaga sp.]
MNTPLYIAWRYLRSKSSQNVINIINRMTIFVLIVGGTSLMIVIAGFAGLKSLSLSFSNFFDPDLKIIPITGKTITLNEEIISKLNKNNHIISYTKVLEERVFLNHKDKNHIAYIKGVDDNYNKVNAIDSILVVSPDEWLLNDEYVVVGYYISQALNLGLFTNTTPLQIIVPKSGKGSVTSSSQPYREETVLISDYYQVTEELDGKYVFASLPLAQRLLGLPDNEVSGIELKINPKAKESEVKKELLSIFDNKVLVKNRVELNEDLYKMFNTENLATYLIFTLVLIVALFNLVGAIIMMILDKKENLRTLYALGLNVSQLRRIFFLQGFLVSLIGAILGVGLGVFLAWLQANFPFLYINPDAISPVAYPMQIIGNDVVIVFFTIFILGIIASWIGANRVSQKLIS